MNIIALTTNLHPGILQGGGNGVVISSLNREQFLEDLNQATFRGVYFTDEDTSREILNLIKFLEEGLDDKIAKRLAYLPQLFHWTDNHSVIYYLEPLSSLEGVDIEPAYFRIEKRPYDYISDIK